MADTRIDKTALSYWFPKIELAGLPVPRTLFLQMPRAAMKDIWGGFDGKEGTGALLKFADQIATAGAELGFPCFLRTDHTSNKHNWKDACFLPGADGIAGHIFQIAEFSEICDMIGLPWYTWVVREFLPTIPYGVCPDYGDMPVCKEFRFFVDDGKVRCWHPYWPAHALEQGGATGIDFDGLGRMDDLPALTALAEAAGRAVGGSWSVDILETKRGWFVTDMAEAHKSFHWEDCATNVSVAS